jgi:hypothetical protein
MKNTCGGCASTWTGANMAHCRACCETFSSVALFDLHRQGGMCTHPGSIVYGEGHRRAGEPRMRQNDRGVWIGNEPVPEFWKAAA